MAPRVPMKFREVVYTLSPYEQTIMNGLWKNLPHKAAHFAERVRGAFTAWMLQHAVGPVP